MANPNIYSATSIVGETITADLTTTLTTALLSGTSNKVKKINSIIVANINSVNTASFNMYIDDGVNTRAFAYQISVPAGSSVVIIDRNSGFYLQDTQIIEGGASLNGYLIATPVSYTHLRAHETLS
jgi:hypothetical protein